MKKQLRLWMLLFVLVPSMAFGQSATINGNVTDENGEPLIGANVLIEQLVIGASTDINGNYSFSVPSDLVNGQTVTLRTGFIGYSDQSMTITLTSGTQTHNFQLEQDLLRLDEVVVTGVTEATPTKKLAFTVSKLDTEKIQQAPASTAIETMQGKIAGASVVKASGAPGESASVRLRGSTSITGSSTPLYIVDGVILGADQVDIGALDVESMEVVKGAAASSLYGARAQAGVIQITTRRGSDIPLNQTRVTIRNEFGLNDLENTLVTNSAHNFVVNSAGEFLNSDGNVIPYGPGVEVDRTANGESFFDNPYVGQTFNAFDQFFNPGNSYTNYIAIAQNSAKTNFHVSFENLNEAGIIEGLNGLERRNVRINLDHRLSSKLSLSASGFYGQSSNDSPRSASSEGTASINPFFGLMFTSPLADLSARDENGDLIVQADPLAVEENPIYLIENTDIGNDRSRVYGNFRGAYNVTDWLDIEGNFSYDRSDRDQAEFYDRGFDTIDPSSLNDGTVERRNALSEAINYDVTASLRRVVGDLTLRTQLKYQGEALDTFSESIIGSDIAVLNIQDLSNVQGEKTVASTFSTVRSDGYYATFGVDYADKYIADFLIRRDGSSLFGPDERWHNYFRVSGAYRVSEEDWWPAADAIPEFKLRGSYGTAGGRPRFEAQYETFSLSNGTIVKNTLGNKALKPELQSELELGVDIGILDRIFLELVYADSRVEDQLLAVPLAGYFGFTSQWQNAGTLESQTFEATLNANLLRTRDMSFDIGIVFDQTTQEISEFNTNAFVGGPQNRFYYREGEVLGAMYGEQWIETVSQLPADQQGFADFFQVNDDGYLVPVGQGNSFQDGISGELWGTSVDLPDGTSYAWGIPLRFEEADGSNFSQIGDALPDFNLGLPINFRYKGFSAGMLWNAQIGGDVYNFTKQWSYRDGRAADQDQTGKADGLKKTQTYYETLYNATGSNSHFVEDGTYIKLRELSLSYSFNRSQLSGLFGNVLNRVSISAIGRNLLTITDYTGFDPEVGTLFSSGGGVGTDATLYRVDNFSYPNFRTITGRLEIQF